MPPARGPAPVLRVLGEGGGGGTRLAAAAPDLGLPIGPGLAAMRVYI